MRVSEILREKKEIMHVSYLYSSRGKNRNRSSDSSKNSRKTRGCGEVVIVVR